MTGRTLKTAAPRRRTSARRVAAKRPARRGARVVNPVDAYARDIVAGRIAAGKYHRLACQRHLADRGRENTKGFPFQFVWEERTADGKLAPCALRFFAFARKCKHYKGEWAGQFFEPTPFQVFVFGSVFGWRHVDTGLRRFTTSYTEVPRKQGKSFSAAIVGLYGTFFEGEPGAEGYVVATKEEQAKIVFNDAKQIVLKSGLTKYIKVSAKNLHRTDTVSKFEPLGSDSDSTDGLNPYVITVDELHAWKTRGLLDVMESATGARRTHLNNQITTAGSDLVSVCGDQHSYACQILDGVLEDDPSTLSFFAMIAHADVNDDPWAESTWRKANPHYGISVKPEDIQKLAAKAKNMPASAAEFKQKRLNLWVNSDQPWLSLEGWQKGQSTGWTLEDLAGEECWIGIDLSSKIDLTALVCVFPPKGARKSFRLVPFVWTPLDTIRDRAHRDRAPYDIWEGKQHLIGVAGSSIKLRVVREKLVELRDKVAIRGVGFDPWHAETLVEDLVDDEGFDEALLAEIPQTFAGMSAACLRFEAEVLAGNVDVGDSPLMAWCVSNTVVQRDGKDNIQPIKKKSRGRIDPVVAANIGLAVYLRMPQSKKKKKKPSVYQRRGAMVVTAEGVQPLGPVLDDLER